MDQERRKVLQLVSNRIISADEGLRLLGALSEATLFDQDFQPALAQPPPKPPTSRPAWATYWREVFGLGVFFATVGVGYSVMALFSHIYWAWLLFTIPMLAFGAGVALFGWLMVTSAWLRISIKDPNTNIHFSLPIPLHWVASLIRVARPWVPQLRTMVTDDILETIAASIRDTDFNIEVQEASGEHVLVSYG